MEIMTVEPAVEFDATLSPTPPRMIIERRLVEAIKRNCQVEASSILDELDDVLMETTGEGVRTTMVTKFPEGGRQSMMDALAMRAVEASAVSVIVMLINRGASPRHVADAFSDKRRKWFLRVLKKEGIVLIPR